MVFPQRHGICNTFKDSNSVFRIFEVFEFDYRCKDFTTSLANMGFMKRMMVLLLLAACGQGILFSQSTNVSGIVNSVLSAVSAINPVSNSVTLTDPSGFAPGDSVLIIQMKGATMNTANAATFGDISAINSAGKYEINVICSVTGSDVVMERNFLNTYSVAGRVQLIKIPSYNAVVVNGTVSAQPWNGSTGGVVIFSAREWVRLDADIDVSGQGFRNGWDHSNYAGQGCDCNCAGGQYTNFYYPVFSCRAADKGEGIADSVATMEFGKGKESTGGGGGNDHNAGGGGGSNFGVGGNGGTSNAPTCFAGAYCRGLNFGFGGVSLNATGFISNAQNRIFLGGGGGSGHDNNGTGTAGARGGGIVIILADSLHLNSRTINARGRSQSIFATSDGSGGGGAGGTVVIDARVVQNVAGVINVSGGAGGTDSWTVNTQGCKGPGGGGGGGLIWSKNVIPAAITTLMGGGTNGTNCSGANGAQAGGTGGMLNSLVIPVSGSTFPPCVLPVEYSYFTATPEEGTGIILAWGTSNEQRNRLFKIEHSADGQRFSPLATVQSTSAYGEGREYSYLDRKPVNGTNWYRIKQVDANGASAYSEVRMVVFGAGETVIGSVYPNPVRTQNTLNLDVYAMQSADASMRIHDIAGRLISEKSFALEAGNNTLQLPLQSWSAGSYMLELHIDGQRAIYRRFSVVE
jgi:hypothetical protein